MTKALSFMAEFQTTPRGSWHGNQLRFARESEAQAYGADLYLRWTQPIAWRVVKSPDPPTHVWRGHNAIALEEPAKNGSAPS